MYDVTSGCSFAACKVL